MKLGALNSLVRNQKLQQAAKNFREEQSLQQSSQPVENSTSSLLFDIGTFSLLAGLLNTTNPHQQPLVKDFHSWVYRYDLSRGFASGLDHEKKLYFGLESHESSSFIPHPIVKSGGWLSNLNDFSKLIKHVVGGGANTTGEQPFKSKTENLPFLLTGYEYLNGQCGALGKLTRIVFEELNSSKFAFQEQTKCGLVGSGLTNGTVVNIGFGTNYSITYQDGQPKAYTVNHGLNGNYFSDLFVKIMTDREQYVDTRSDRARVVKAKEANSFVSLDFEAENVDPIDYQLPDGKIIHLENERYEAYESLFEPTRNFINPYKPELEESFIPLPQMILKQLGSSPINKSVMENILLMGGVCTVSGLPKRLFMELDLLVKDDTIHWNIVQAPDRYLAYRGLSMMASLSSFETDCYITKQEYEESGESVYVRRFPRVVTVADEEEQENKRTTAETSERDETFKSQEAPKQEEQPKSTSANSKQQPATTQSTTKTTTPEQQPKVNTVTEKKQSYDFDAQMEQLKKLKELLDSGILTPEEFAEKKKKVLGL